MMRPLGVVLDDMMDSLNGKGAIVVHESAQVLLAQSMDQQRSERVHARGGVQQSLRRASRHRLRRSRAHCNFYTRRWPVARRTAVFDSCPICESSTTHRVGVTDVAS